MNIRITSRKFKAKETLNNFIRDEVKSLEKYNDQILDVKVILSYTHLKDSIKSCEITLNLPGKVITVSADSDEYEKAIPIAIEKIRKQLRKIKTKRLARPKNEK